MILHRSYDLVVFKLWKIEKDFSTYLFKLTFYCCIIMCICLVCVFVIYLFVWERSNLLICLFVCFFVCFFPAFIVEYSSIHRGFLTIEEEVCMNVLHIITSLRFFFPDVSNCNTLQQNNQRFQRILLWAIPTVLHCPTQLVHVTAKGHNHGATKFRHHSGQIRVNRSEFTLEGFV